jgi:hypothetical protein
MLTSAAKVETAQAASKPNITTSTSGCACCHGSSALTGTTAASYDGRVRSQRVSVKAGYVEVMVFWQQRFCGRLGSPRFLWCPWLSPRHELKHGLSSCLGPLLLLHQSHKVERVILSPAGEERRQACLL